MKLDTNLLIIKKNSEIEIQTFSYTLNPQPSIFKPDFDILMTELYEKGDRDNILEKINDFTLSFGKLLMIFNYENVCKNVYDKYMYLTKNKIITLFEAFDKNLISSEKD